MPQGFELEGARVLVAGAGGLGGACARGFLDQGANVLVVDVDSQRLDALEEIGDPTAGLHTRRADLATGDSCRRTVDAAAEVLGGIDCFVHAVGINDRRPLLSFQDEDWELILNTNLSSAYWLGQAVGRVMCAHGAGRLVFVSSVSGLLAHAEHGPYAASKGGMNQLMRVMAMEWAASGVGVNAIAPGYTETDLTNGYLDRPGIRDALTSLVPAGRLGTPDDIVGAALFLASPLAAFITGQVLYIDGGRTLV